MRDFTRALAAVVASMDRRSGSARSCRDSSAITDFNADGRTDAADLAIVLSFFGLSIAPEGISRSDHRPFDAAANEAATAAMLEAADADGDGRASSAEIASYLGALGAR